MTDQHSSTGRERALLAKLVYESVRFAIWAAGEGFAPQAGQDAEAPEDFIFDYSVAIGADDWGGLAELARDAIGSAQQQPATTEAEAEAATEAEAEAELDAWFHRCMAKHGYDVRAVEGSSDIAPSMPDLTDPVVVHANMLRGTIARPSSENMRHLYPDEFVNEERLIRCINMAMGCLDPLSRNPDEKLAWHRLLDAIEGREPRAPVTPADSGGAHDAKAAI